MQVVRGVKVVGGVNASCMRLTLLLSRVRWQLEGAFPTHVLYSPWRQAGPCTHGNHFYLPFARCEGTVTPGDKELTA